MSSKARGKRGAATKRKPEETVEGEEVEAMEVERETVTTTGGGSEASTTRANGNERSSAQSRDDGNYTENGRFKDEQERQQWALNMRKKFTPKEMLNEDGTINHNWFKPKTTTIKVKKWGGRERELLIKGIEKHGVGNWTQIKADGLPEWEEQDLRLKTMRLIGRQNLQSYRGWKGDEAAIQKEYEKNHAIGADLNCWKGGVLVADDGGLVEKALKEADVNLKATPAAAKNE